MIESIPRADLLKDVMAARRKKESALYTRTCCVDEGDIIKGDDMKQIKYDVVFEVDELSREALAIILLEAGYPVYYAMDDRGVGVEFPGTDVTKYMETIEVINDVL